MDKTLIKGLCLLEALAASEQPRGVTSLARELELTKSNVHRLLLTFQSKNYVRQNAANASYELTSKVWELGVLVRSRLDIVKVAQPEMRDLAKSTGESVHLSILDGLEVVYVDKIESTHPISSYTRIGGRAPAWCVATGKAMLAHMEPDVLNQIEFSQFTSRTLTDINALRDELSQARNVGYAVNRGEWREDVFGIATALLDGTGQIVGGIGISGPSNRFKARKIEGLAASVTNAAAQISRTLGYDSRHPNLLQPGGSRKFQR